MRPQMAGLAGLARGPLGGREGPAEIEPAQTRLPFILAAVKNMPKWAVIQDLELSQFALHLCI